MQYLWENRISIKPFETSEKIRKIVIKAKKKSWVNTDKPIIIPFSIHSTFHQGKLGMLKVSKFLESIAEHSRGKVTFLLTEAAHINVLSMQFNNDSEKAYKVALKDAQELESLCTEYIQKFDVKYWHSFIWADPDYEYFKNKVSQLAKTDANFIQLLKDGAEKTYTQAQQEIYPDKELYVCRTIQDLMEHCVYQFIIAKHGYAYEFYHGDRLSFLEYINDHCIPLENRIERIAIKISLW